MSTVEARDDGGGSPTFAGTVIDTAGTKGLILVLYLIGVTAMAAVTGLSVVEGVLPGALLVALLALGSLVEVSVLRRPIDHVGVLIMGIALAYAVLEYMRIVQGVWFPAASGGVLLASVAVDAVRHREGPGFDVVETIGNIDIVGLYGGMLLLIYALLVSGDQIAFVYTPYFPAIALAFAVSILITSVAYVSRAAAAQDDTDQLHHRLVSVIESLTEVHDAEEKREIAQHVRAVAGALNGVRLPSEIEDDEGRVPLVLPVSHDMIAFRAGTLEDAIDQVDELDLHGFLVDTDRNVVLIRDGEPVKYFMRSTERYDDDLVRLSDTEAFDGDVRGYHADPTLIEDILAVTPEPGDAVDLLEETEQEIERRLGDAGEAAVDAGAAEDAGAARAEGASEGETKRPTQENYDIRDIQDVDGDDGVGETAEQGPNLDVGGRDIDLEEMLEEANKVFDEDAPY